MSRCLVVPPPAFAVAGALLACWLAPVCHGHGGYDEEIQRADEQIAAKPDDGTLWMRRGYLNFLHGDWQQSLIDLEKADRLAPGKLYTDYVRGQALALGGQMTWGKSVLDKFIAEHGAHAEAFAARARILGKMNQWADAAKDFSLAIEKSKSPEPDLYRENAEAWMAAGQVDAAVAVLQAGMTKLGEIPQLALMALDLELATHRYDAALSRIAAMQKSAPRPEPWMARRARVLGQAGRKAEATAEWTALRDHIASLPNLQRGSNAMSQITAEAEREIAALSSPPRAPPTTASTTTPPNP